MPNNAAGRRKKHQNRLAAINKKLADIQATPLHTPNVHVHDIPHTSLGILRKKFSHKQTPVPVEDQAAYDSSNTPEAIAAWQTHRPDAEPSRKRASTRRTAAPDP